MKLICFIGLKRVGNVLGLQKLNCTSQHRKEMKVMTLQKLMLILTVDVRPDNFFMPTFFGQAQKTKSINT